MAMLRFQSESVESISSSRSPTNRPGGAKVRFCLATKTISHFRLATIFAFHCLLCSVQMKFSVLALGLELRKAVAATPAAGGTSPALLVPHEHHVEHSTLSSTATAAASVIQHPAAAARRPVPAALQQADLQQPQQPEINPSGPAGQQLGGSPKSPDATRSDLAAWARRHQTTGGAAAGSLLLSTQLHSLMP
ncbi:unnamed protein product, partial [Amoebophrya sp. A120]|eukprot:GSA120T00010042001.1